MVLSYNSYKEVQDEGVQKIKDLETDIESLKQGINNIMNLIQQNPIFAYIKPEIMREKIESNSR